MRFMTSRFQIREGCREHWRAIRLGPLGLHQDPFTPSTLLDG